jgi:hypothetical protein
VRFAPEYITYVLNENFEDAKRLFLSPLMAIHYAHLVMLASPRLVSAEAAHAIRRAPSETGRASNAARQQLDDDRAWGSGAAASLRSAERRLDERSASL